MLPFHIMGKIPIFMGAVLCLLAVPATAADLSCAGDIPPVRSIDRTCLPVAPPRANVPLYNTDLAEQYQEIATVDSFISTDQSAETTRRQLKDLQAKGQGIGADAMIRVRVLANDFRGWQENADTPFWSVKQGTSKDYFFRATAVKYLRQPDGDPTPMAVPAPRPAVTTVSPLINTNDLLKINNNKTFRREVTVPEVYTSNTPAGAP